MKQADAIWNKGPELIDDDGEVRELTKEDFAKMVPFSELPADLRHVLSEIQKGNVTIRADETVGVVAGQEAKADADSLRE